MKPKETEVSPREWIFVGLHGDGLGQVWPILDGPPLSEIKSKIILREVVPETTDVVKVPNDAWLERYQRLYGTNSDLPADRAGAEKLRLAAEALSEQIMTTQAEAFRMLAKGPAESVEAVRFAALEKCDEMYGPYGDDVPNTKCFMTGIDWLLARLKQSEGK